MNRIQKVTKQLQDPEQASLVRAACRAALTGGSILRELYGKPHTIEMKGTINLVTEADIASETAILASLEEDTPGIAVLAEESAADTPEDEQGRQWIVDPLDGTTNFAHGFPFFGTSIALLDRGSPLVGVVYCPMQDELFCAVKGAGAWLNGQPIAVTDTRFLLEALVATGFPYDIHAALDQILAQLRAILPRVRDIRRAGAAALDLAYVACGRLDGFWEMDLKPWDTAAGWLLVTEAGGRVSDFAGNDYSPFLPSILASNGVLHEQLGKLIA
ncbi:inositol monophosphatase family protein [Desulfolithobacter sp.]